MQTSIPPGIPRELRALFTRNLENATSMEHVISGIYEKAGGNHFVMAAVPSFRCDTPVLMLSIADKILTQPPSDIPWSKQSRLARMSGALARLNRGCVAGIHELFEFPTCVIYTFKQCLLLTSDITDRVFRSIVEQGIAEFETGLSAIRGSAAKIHDEIRSGF